ncbi:MAG: CocE/NonD family hydrolase, partial [Solirubrobacterales bacterium]
PVDRGRARSGRLARADMGAGAQGSEAVHEVALDRDVMAEMRDGVELAVDVYRPDSAGEFPALLSMSPYSKDTEDLAGLGSELGCFNVEFAAVEAGDHDFWARHGYAHVIADVRGTGKSDGEYLNLTSPQEQQDGYDLVEWVAAQPWCDGNVGMTGISYLAFIQYLVAAQRPPHLRAIFPHDGWADLYRDIMYQGGIPSVFGLILDQVIATGTGVPVSRELYGAEEMQRRAEARKQDPASSIAKNAIAYKALTLPDVHPIAFDILLHDVDGPFYRERSPASFMDRIEVPTYLGSERHAYPVTMHLPGVTTGWELIDAPKKVAFQPVPDGKGGFDRPFHELHDEMLRWFDHWLKGIDTGLMDEPPVKVWVRGAEEWRTADEWPLLSATDWRKLYLRGEGRLAWDEAPREGEGSERMGYEPQMPVLINPEPLSPPPPSISYATDPFTEDVDVIGPLALYLHASLSGEDGDFIVTVADVDSDGGAFVLSRGWLRASHRELDAERSKEWQPFHPHTDPEPVPPGEMLEYAIAIQPIANRFAAGHRLRLEIWPCDYPSTDSYDWTGYWGSCQHIPYGLPVGYEIAHSPAHPSYLLLPQVQPS